jgi:hypothetical protein
MDCRACVCLLGGSGIKRVATWRAIRASSRWSLPGLASNAASSGTSRSRARTESSGAAPSIADFATSSPRDLRPVRRWSNGALPRTHQPVPGRHRLMHETGGGLRGIGLLDTAREVDHGQAQAGAEQHEFGGRFEPEVGNPAAVLDGFLESGIRWRRQHQTPIVG